MTSSPIVASGLSPSCPTCARKMGLGPNAWICMECRTFRPFDDAVPDPDLLGVSPSQLPFLLSIPVDEFLGASGKPLLQLWYSFEILEMLLKLGVIVGVFEIGSVGGLSPEFLRKFGFKIQAPTIGAWNDLAKRTEERLEHLAKGAFQGEEKFLVPELRGFLAWLTGFLETVVSIGGWEGSLLALRNHLAHGGGGIGAGLSATTLEKVVVPGFRELFAREEWIRDLRFVVKKDSGEWGVLHGSKAEPGPVADVQVPPRASGGFVYTPGTIGLMRAGRPDHFLPLHPLIVFEGVKKPFSGKIYSRQDCMGIDFTDPWAVSFGPYRGNEGHLQAFRRLFGLDRMIPDEWKLPGFETEIFQDASAFVGRRVELENARREIREALDSTYQPDGKRVLWLPGGAGIGKSFLVSKLAVDSEDELQKAFSGKTLVLPWRFRVGDQRCGAIQFCLFALERTGRSLCNTHEKGTQGSPTGRPNESPEKAEENLVRMLSDLGGNRILFFLDGLDELERVEPGAPSRLVSSLSLPGTVWFCSGRPDPSLEAMPRLTSCRVVSFGAPPGTASGSGVTIPTPSDGLSPMSEKDMAEILEPAFGRLADHILRTDLSPESREAAFRLFLGKVLASSGGNPLFIRHLTRDIEEGRITSLENLDRIPASLDAYLENLCHRVIGIGSLFQVLTPLVCHLAIAMEPLTQEVMSSILAQRGIVPPGPPAGKLTHRGTLAVSSLLRTAPDSNNEPGNTLYHASIREHILGSERMRNAVLSARMALRGLIFRRDAWDSPAGPYLLRWGVRHLLAEGNSPKASLFNPLRKLFSDPTFFEKNSGFGLLPSLMRNIRFVIDFFSGETRDAEMTGFLTGLSSISKILARRMSFLSRNPGSVFQEFSNGLAGETHGNSFLTGLMDGWGNIVGGREDFWFSSAREPAGEGPAYVIPVPGILAVSFDGTGKNLLGGTADGHLVSWATATLDENFRKKLFREPLSRIMAGPGTVLICESASEVAFVSADSGQEVGRHNHEKPFAIGLAGKNGDFFGMTAEREIFKSSPGTGFSKIASFPKFPSERILGSFCVVGNDLIFAAPDHSDRIVLTRCCLANRASPETCFHSAEKNRGTDPDPGEILTHRLVGGLGFGRGGAGGASISPDGKLLAGITRDAELLVFETGTGETVFSRKTGLRGLFSLCGFSGDGHFLAVVDDSGEVNIFEVPSGNLLNAFRHSPSPEPGNGPSGTQGGFFSFSPDGTRFAITGSEVRVYEVATNARNRGGSGITAVSGGPARRLLGFSSGEIQLREMPPGRASSFPDRHDGKVTGLAISRRFSKVLSTGFEGMLKVWDCPEAKEAETGRAAISTGGLGASLENSFQVHQSEVIASCFCEKRMIHASIGADWKLVVVLFDEPKPVPAGKGYEPLPVKDLLSFELPFHPTCISIDPDKSLVFCGGKNGELGVCSVERKELLNVMELGLGRVTGLQVKFPDSLLLSTGRGEVFQIPGGCDRPSPQRIFSGDSPLSGILFDPFRKLLYLSNADGELRAWSFRKNRTIGAFGGGGEAPVFSISPDYQGILGGDETGLSYFIEPCGAQGQDQEDDGR